MAESNQQAQSFGDIQMAGDGNSLVINQIVQSSSAIVQTRPFIDRSPYLGLRRFEEKDRALFFGRDAVVAKLLSALRDHHLTLVAGASGSGKSSVVRAGLIPELHRHLGRLRVLTMVPDRDPFARLQAALLQAGFDLDEVANTGAASDETLLSLCTKLRAEKEPWLLFIDQFEEIFTLCSDFGRRHAFLDGLTKLIESGPAEVKVLVAMRADFFDRFDPHPRLLELAQAPFFVTSPSEAELRQCIEQPAAQHGVTFEDGLVSEILHDVRGQAGALPLLQYTLDRLWAEDQPSDDHLLNTDNYRKLGGISGALKQRADELYRFRSVGRQRTRKEQRPADQCEAMRRVFLRLLDLSEHGDNARAISNRALLSELTTDEQQLAMELADEKLLVTNRTADGQATIEVAHEALLTAWPQLQDWVAQARDVIYVRNRLCADASVWHKAQAAARSNAAEELWRGARLARAIEMTQRGDFSRIVGELPPSAREFLLASVAEQERVQERERQRQKELEDALRYAQEQQRQAERARAQAEQRELDLVTEQGRQLLLEQDKPTEAILWLQQAYARGSQSAMLPYLLAEAIRPLDATRLILRGHKDCIASACYSQDGRWIVTASWDKTAQIWDAETGRPLLTLLGHTDYVSSAVPSPNGRRVVTASLDRTVRVWDAETGHNWLTLHGHTGAVFWAAYSLDGCRIVTASDDKTVRVWCAETGKLVLTLHGHTSSVCSASYSANGLYIVTASQDHTARVWDSGTGSSMITLRGHTDGVCSASYSPDLRHIVTASRDKTARLWSAETGKLVVTMKGHASAVYAASYSPDGGRILTASRDKLARVWDAKTGQTVATLPAHQAPVYHASYSSDGRHILTASGDKTVRVWRSDLGKPLLKLLGHRSAVHSASYSPDGRRIMTAGADSSARVWDAKTGKPVSALLGSLGPFHGASYRPDGRHIVTAGPDASAQVWDAETGERVVSLQGHAGSVLSATYSPDGRRIVTASRDHSARVWAADNGQPMVTLQGHQAAVASASYNPDGRFIVTASWDKTARVWDADTGRPVLTLQGHTDFVAGASYRPDGRHIVTASWDNGARVWDAVTGELVVTLQGHANSVFHASYSPDGRFIITASRDHTARIWDAATGRPIINLPGHQSGVADASYSPDGRRVVTCSYDGTARVWDVGPETRRADELAKVLRGRLARRLEGGAAVWAPLDESADAPLPAPPQPPAHWDTRDLALWTGVYALQAGCQDTARAAFQQARTDLLSLQDERLLAALDLAEAALRAHDDVSAPAGIAERVGGTPPGGHLETWQWLAGFAHDFLYRPRWALWAIDRGLALAPEHSGLRAWRLRFLLAAGRAADVLREGHAVWTLQQEPNDLAAVAALVCLAAAQQANRAEQQAWSARTVESYRALPDGAVLGWNFAGNRQAFLLQPDSTRRTKALELFALLEHEKSGDSVEKLIKMRGAPPPR